MSQIDSTSVATQVSALTGSVRPVVPNNQALQVLDQVTSAKDGTQAVVENVEAVQEAVARVNREFEQSEIALQFVMDEVIDRPIVSVIDRDSGELLRQLPSEEVLRAARNIESMKGILLNSQS